MSKPSCFLGHLFYLITFNYLNKSPRAANNFILFFEYLRIIFAFCVFVFLNSRLNTFSLMFKNSSDSVAFIQYNVNNIFFAFIIIKFPSPENNSITFFEYLRIIIYYCLSFTNFQGLKKNY